MHWSPLGVEDHQNPLSPEIVGKLFRCSRCPGAPPGGDDSGQKNKMEGERKKGQKWKKLKPASS